MKRANYFLIIICCVMALGCSIIPEVEMTKRECAVLPAGGRASACACALEGKGYVLGGRDSVGTYHNDLWEYDPVANEWASLGKMPGKARVNAVIIGYNGCLYAGLGHAQTGPYTENAHLRDWWRYTPSTKRWDSLAPYPTENTISPVPYVSGSRIYTIYGSSDCFSRDMTWYNTETDQWQTEEDSHYRALSAFLGVGAEVQGKYYYGLGYDTSNLNQWYRVDLEEDDWTECTSLPVKGRSGSAACATDSYIYIFGGRYFAGEKTGGQLFSDILRYDPVNDGWARGGAMPCGEAENQIAFAIDGKVYFGLGENTDGEVIDKIYCIDE